MRFSALVGGALAALSITGAGYAPVANAQVTTNQRSFDIPAGPLSQAALRFSEQAGVQLVLGSDVSEGLRTGAVQGRYTVAEALDRLLAGSGLEWRYASAGVVAIERPGQTIDVGETGNEVFGTVRVEGAQNLDAGGFGKLDSFGAGAGANGSSDPVSTEGTGSYTTNGSVVASGGIPRPLQETTQSVTVMTNQRLEEQNLTDLNQAISFTPGITVNTISGTDQRFSTRGFDINSFTVDGGAPLFFNNGSFQGSIDLGQYDRIELLRGSSGLYGAVGDPGGVISLVRKRPLDNKQFLLELQAGSFNDYRVLADVTGPIAFGGRLRARAVLTAQVRDFFFDTQHDDRVRAFGSLEADLTKSTVLRFGGSFQNQKVVGVNRLGVPRYFNGDPLPLPRNASFSAPFDRQDLDTTELFAAFEQRFGEKWTLKLDATRAQTKGDTLELNLERVTAISSGLLRPGDTRGTINGNVSQGTGDARQYGLQASLVGRFDLFGNEQRVSLGGIKSHQSTDTNTNGLLSPRSATFDFGGPNGFVFDRDQLGGAPMPGTRVISTAELDGTGDILGVYGTLDLEPVDRLRLTAGLRYTKTEGKARFALISPIFGTFEQLNETKDEGWVPSLSALYEATDWLAGYVSYNGIFSSQNTLLSPDGEPLEAARGDTYEGGIRVKLRDGKLNGHLAYYDTRVNNRNVALGSQFNPNRLPNCCSATSGRSLSHGIDAELNGEILEGFQLALSYNLNNNRFSGFSLRPGQPDTLSSLTPKHQVKIWSSYDFRTGPLSGLSFGLGLRLESSRTIFDSICATNPCNPALVNNYFAFTQSGYQVVDGLVNYRLSENIELSVNLYNILDRKYFAQPAGIGGGNFYGVPRSFMFTLRTIVGDRYPGK